MMQVNQKSDKFNVDKHFFTTDWLYHLVKRNGDIKMSAKNVQIQLYTSELVWIKEGITISWKETKKKCSYFG